MLLERVDFRFSNELPLEHVKSSRMFHSYMCCACCMFLLFLDQCSAGIDNVQAQALIFASILVRTSVLARGGADASIVIG
ncbi:hypothetical protein AcW1_005853 [Taiwanofungus camphoratus]|nr:hypothetical protein AcW1_005853 [Antrodia cinnamomea]